MADRTWTGWHFLAEGKKLRNGDGRDVIVGEWMAARMPARYPTPTLCESGMHASKRVIDALQYALSPMLCRVELRGQIVDGEDKSTAMERRVLWMADVDKTLRLFAIWCAERAIETAEKLSGLTDSDKAALAAGRECNRINRLYLDGQASAAARDAASAAARGAASVAARDAAWGAARGAASAAAWGAAWGAARDAAWGIQAKKLDEMCLALAPPDAGAKEEK